MTTTQERKQADRKVRRQRIQAAARGVFCEKGYAKTSIEQIAKQANLSVGAIYLYFRSKEDLYASLLEETLDTLSADLRGIRAADGSLRDAWGYLTRWAIDDVESTRVLRLVSQPGVRKQLSDEVAEGVAARLSTIQGDLAQAIEATYGVAEAVPAADLLWTLFLGLLQQSDARTNLGMPGLTFAEGTEVAFDAFEASLRRTASTLRAA